MNTHTINMVFSIRDLQAGYGQKAVLHDVNIDIPPRSITAIIGPSGCGKSTFLRCLNRMNDLTPDFHMRGKIMHRDEDVYAPTVDVTHLRRRIGMVFDNVAYGLRIHGMRDSKKITEKVHDSLVKAALWDEVKDHLTMPALRLSGGQQQRLCIARTIAVEPEVILFDEPCSALDPVSTRNIENLIVQLKKDYALIVVTHNLKQAHRIADYVGLFHMGRLVEFGVMKQVFEQPAHHLTRDYVQGVFG